MRMLVALALVAMSSPAAAVLVASGSGTIDANDTVINPRIFRDGNASTWAAPKLFPGTTSSGVSETLAINFAPNATQNVFYEVNFTSLTGDNTHATAYANLFNPADISVNYLGDAGASPTLGNSRSFQFIALAGVSPLLQFTAIGSASTYSYTVNAFSDADRNENFGVPEPQSWMMLIAGFGLVGAMARRRAAATA